MVEGYQRRCRAQAVYFREMYALTYNLHRSEKTPYMEPSEVLNLPGEKKKRKPRIISGWTDEEIREAQQKHSTPTAWQEPLI